MSAGRVALLALWFWAGSWRACAGGVLDGIGVMGDSYSDEYGFYPDNRGAARNWVELLAERRGLNFGKFGTASRGEPRNQGYEFNWARSDATTDDLIASGQHTGLAAQVARGEVTLVCVFIGGNDFLRALKAPDPAGALRAAVPRAARNFRTAVDTVLAAAPGVKTVLWTVPDVRGLPELAEAIRTGQISSTAADACTRAIAEFNAAIRALAARERRRVAVMDLAVAVNVASRLAPDAPAAAGWALDRQVAGNGPGRAFLADGRHLSTLGHVLLARYFIATVNLRFRAGVPPLTDRELVAYRGPAGSSK